MKTKWIFTLLAVVFVIFFILFLLGLALSQDLFFQDWKMKAAVITPQGYIQATLENPEDGEIKSVVVLTFPDGTVISYWFFKNGEPEFWEGKGDGTYERNPKQERGCTRCHGQQVRL